MNIENEIFERTIVNFSKLEKYGFKKEKNKYIYSKNFINDNFKANITIDENSIVSGKVYDLDTGEEYTNIRIENNVGKFVNSVKEGYKNILKDIRENCFEKVYFKTGQANRITNYIKEKYGNDPEFLWDKLPGYGVFRNKENDKWYSIIMNIDKSKIDNGNGETEIINVKINENNINNFLKKKGFYKAYHMNKKSWITIILDNTVSDEVIFKLIDNSYNLINL